VSEALSKEDFRTLVLEAQKQKKKVSLEKAHDCLYYLYRRENRTKGIRKGNR
jgi:hypothetical protein